MSLIGWFNSLRRPKSSVPLKNDGGSPADAGGAGGVNAAATSVTPANLGRTLLIHGYSADGNDLKPWRDELNKLNIPTVSIEIGNYITLNNEVTIKDLGEAFDRALRFTEWSSASKDDTWTFDAIVHSTGMLVVRQWLTSDPFPVTDQRSRVRRLKHLIGLAPATFGSPQAQKGRSWLGAIVKGNQHLGPDFLNAGNQVLDGLELGSRYTWELAHKDMLGPTPLYGQGNQTPYVAVFIGNKAYCGLAALSNSPGCDGTVRWAGCSLNTRKVSLDFRREPRLADGEGNPLKDAQGNSLRCSITAWELGRLAAPMIAVEGQNHGTIVAEPDAKVAGLIKSFVAVTDEASYGAWETGAEAFGADALEKMNAESIDGTFGGAGWQQLVVRTVDDHGDGVTDYNVQLFIGEDLKQSDDPDFRPVPLIADTYSSDGSYRCFYIRLSKDMLTLNTPQGEKKKMWIELIASSGSKLIEYEAYTGQANDPQRLTIDHDGGSPVKLDITLLAQGTQTLLYPYTTTLLELFVEREPMPLGQVSQIFNFLPLEPKTQ
jgi:hypothetical protein